MTEQAKYTPPRCGHLPWVDGPEEYSGGYGEPDCSEPATFISCVPYSGTPTCAAHRCRCAQPLDANGKTAGERRRDLKLAEAKALDAAVAWMKGGPSNEMQKALHEVIALREAL